MRKIVVAAAILNEDDEVLLLQRSNVGSWAGRWNFPGGKYEASDRDLASGAQREAEEESGLKISDLSFMGKVSFKTFDIYFYYTRTFEGEVELNVESDAYEWVPVEKINEYEFPMTGKLNQHVYDALVKLVGDKNEEPET